MHGTEENYSEVRQQIVDFLKKNEKEYSELVLDKKGQTYKEYLQEMQKDKVWATEVEILAAGPVYECEIFVQVCKQGTDKWEWHRYSKGDKGKCDHTKDYIAIQHRDSHFRLLKLDRKPCLCSGKRSERTRNDKNNKNGEALQGNKKSESGEPHRDPPQRNPFWQSRTTKEVDKWVEAAYKHVALFKPNVFERSKIQCCHRFY